MPSDKSFSLFNTLTRRVEPLRLLEPGHLRFYGCGPTVYSYAHIGNFRSFLTSDLILRTARAIGWKTTYVTNITDVGHLTEDDIIDPSGEDRMTRALRSKEGERFNDVWELARYYEAALLKDWQLLNLLKPDERPRATEHVDEQIEAIEWLVACGAAYETLQGVYFSVPSFSEYGKLSGNEAADALETAVRAVVVDEDKRDARDFALWKKDPGHLMQWNSPWGMGFPGWHIECSVMAQHYLGKEIDLHTGGEDLIFPHHECEIAQAERLTGKPFARHWVHTRFLQVEGQKMSKRLGNFHTVRGLIKPESEGGQGVDPIALRMTLICGHYRHPFNFTFATLLESERHVRRLRLARKLAEEAKSNPRGDDDIGIPLERAYERVQESMLNDLNTPAAIAAVLEGAKVILGRGENLNGTAARSASDFLRKVNDLLGIIWRPALELKETVTAEDPTVTARLTITDDEIKAHLAERTAARRGRDFSRADAIRDLLDNHNIEVMDTPSGSTWRRRSSLEKTKPS